MSGFHDLPHNEDIPQEYELHEQRLQRFRKGK
jgi:hypothetical protein